MQPVLCSDHDVQSSYGRTEGKLPTWLNLQLNLSALSDRFHFHCTIGNVVTDFFASRLQGSSTGSDSDHSHGDRGYHGYMGSRVRLDGGISNSRSPASSGKASPRMAGSPKAQRKLEFAMPKSKSQDFEPGWFSRTGDSANCRVLTLCMCWLYSLKIWVGF